MQLLRTLFLNLWTKAQFEWAAELAPKYVRIQLSRHLSTTVWEHIDWVQQHDPHCNVYRNKFATLEQCVFFVHMKAYPTLTRQWLVSHAIHTKTYLGHVSTKFEKHWFRTSVLRITSIGKYLASATQQVFSFATSRNLFSSSAGPTFASVTITLCDRLKFMQGSLCEVAERVITLSPTVNPHTLICTANSLVVFPSTIEVTCLSLLHRAYAALTCMTISKKFTCSMLSNNSFPCTSVIHGFEKLPEAVTVCSELNTVQDQAAESKRCRNFTRPCLRSMSRHLQREFKKHFLQFITRWCVITRLNSKPTFHSRSGDVLQNAQALCTNQHVLLGTNVLARLNDTHQQTWRTQTFQKTNVRARTI